MNKSQTVMPMLLIWDLLYAVAVVFVWFFFFIKTNKPHHNIAQISITKITTGMVTYNDQESIDPLFLAF